jgi:hypothetical protein
MGLQRETYIRIGALMLFCLAVGVAVSRIASCLWGD